MRVLSYHLCILDFSSSSSSKIQFTVLIFFLGTWLSKLAKGKREEIVAVLIRNRWAAFCCQSDQNGLGFGTVHCVMTFTYYVEKVRNLEISP